MDRPTPDDLLRCPLLAGLAPEMRTALAGRFEVEDFPAGARVVAEGRSGYAFHVIDQGTAVVTQEGRELRRLGPGDFFGEIAIIGEGRRTATVSADGPLVVWSLFGTEFRTMQHDAPEVAAALEAATRDRLATG
jgi:cAMP-dependent protein kinase regulator